MKNFYWKRAAQFSKLAKLTTMETEADLRVANEIYWQSLGKERERKGHPVLIVRSWVKYLFDGSILSRRLSRTTLWDLNKVVLAG